MDGSQQRGAGNENGAAAGGGGVRRLGSLLGSDRSNAAAHGNGRLGHRAAITSMDVAGPSAAVAGGASGASTSRNGQQHQPMKRKFVPRVRKAGKSTTQPQAAAAAATNSNEGVAANGHAAHNSDGNDNNKGLQVGTQKKKGLLSQNSKEIKSIVNGKNKTITNKKSDKNNSNKNKNKNKNKDKSRNNSSGRTVRIDEDKNETIIIDKNRKDNNNDDDMMMDDIDDDSIYDSDDERILHSERSILSKLPPQVPVSLPLSMEKMRNGQNNDCDNTNIRLDADDISHAISSDASEPDPLAAVFLSHASNNCNEDGGIKSDDDNQYILFQLPHTLPIDVHSSFPSTSRQRRNLSPHTTDTIDNDKDTDMITDEDHCTDKKNTIENGVMNDDKYNDNDGGDTKSTSKGEESLHANCLHDIPASSKIGKLLIYDDNSIQMKIGDVHFDIESGSEINICQHLVAMNKEEKTCAFIGNVMQRAVVMPDIAGMLDNQNI